MADRSNDIPAPAEAQSVVHAKYHEFQIARREAEISQIRLQLSEAEYKDQLRQQEIATIQNEKDALQDKNNALLDKNNTLRVESIALQEENSVLRGEKSVLQTENTALQREIITLQNGIDSPYYGDLAQRRENGIGRNENVDLGIDIRAPWADDFASNRLQGPLDCPFEDSIF